MKSVQNTYFNINISNNKGFASLYDEEKYLFTKIKFRVYWINKIKNICDVVHFVYPTLPQFPAKCGSGVPFFIYFGNNRCCSLESLRHRDASKCRNNLLYRASSTLIELTLTILECSSMLTRFDLIRLSFT